MTTGGPAAALVARLTAQGLTVAVAESLTGGMLCARLVDVPGASAVVRGGVVAYATGLKAELLGVDAGLLAERGPVDPDVALAMAAGVRQRLSADWGMATTGVAGPDPQDGVPPGTVYVAVCGPGGSTAGDPGRAGARVSRLVLTGDRSAVREGTVGAALALLDEALAEHGTPAGS